MGMVKVLSTGQCFMARVFDVVKTLCLNRAFTKRLLVVRLCAVPMTEVQILRSHVLGNSHARF